MIEKLRINLIRHNIPLVRSFNEACSLDETDFGFCQKIHTVIKSGEHEVFEHLRESLEQLKITANPKISYEQLFQSPWQASFADEERHRELHLKMKRFVKSKEEDQPDATLACLGRFIIALSSDLDGLQRPLIVQQMQTRFARLLRNYLRAKFNHDDVKADSRFVEGMRLTSYAREAEDIKSRRLPV